MTYNVFGGTLNLAQSIKSIVLCQFSRKKNYIPLDGVIGGAPLVTPLDAAAAAADDDDDNNNDDDDDDAGHVLCVACRRVVSVVDATTRQRRRITQL